MSDRVNMRGAVVSGAPSDEGATARGPSMRLTVERGLSIPIPSPHEVRIRVKAIGVNPIDVDIVEGLLGSICPFTPGFDCAGDVDSVGSAVHSLQPGDRVYTFSKSKMGCYAEFCVVPENEVFKLLDTLTYAQGACVGLPYFTAYKAMCIMDRVKPGESVLVHGAAGADGLAATQLARAMGLTVIGTARSTEGVELVVKNGAHHCFDENKTGYTHKVTEVTGGAGPDVILEMATRNGSLQTDVDLLAHKGRIHVTGWRARSGVDPWITINKQCEIKITALLQSHTDDIRQCACAVLAGMEYGWLKPVVGRSFPLEEVADAHRWLTDPPQGAGGGSVILTL